MQSILKSVAVLLFAAAATAAYAGGPCCDAEMAKNGWCEKCNAGFFDGVAMKSHKLHDALMGAAVKTDDIKCPGCKKAAESNGICDHCHVAFANNKMYKSMVGYELARGQIMNPADIKCDACKKAAADHGWCDECKAGMVGNTGFKDRAAYEDAVKARQILLTAVKAADKCEGCAVAMVTDGTCADCKVTFKDGKPTKTASDEHAGHDHP